MTLIVLCIPLALLTGLLWGVALEKHRAAKRRFLDALRNDNGSAHWREAPDAPRRRSL